MKTTYKVGDSFWLIPAAYNPIAIKVKVLDVEPDRGYWVDEPVGLVNNSNCVCDSVEIATDRLRIIHEQFSAKAVGPFPWDLEGLRGFLLTTAMKINHPHTKKVVSDIYPLKVEGQDWFKLTIGEK